MTDDTDHAAFEAAGTVLPLAHEVDFRIIGTVDRGSEALLSLMRTSPATWVRMAAKRDRIVDAASIGKHGRLAADRES